jgi:hypothetical protein
MREHKVVISYSSKYRTTGISLKYPPNEMCKKQDIKNTRVCMSVICIIKITACDEYYVYHNFFIEPLKKVKLSL